MKIEDVESSLGPTNPHTEQKRRISSAAGYIRIVCMLFWMLLMAANTSRAEPPQAQISNRVLRATIYLPDPANGFYRGTRFDWSGVIGRLEYAGHTYYGPWFTKTDPAVPDFIYDGPDIVAGPCSAITGPSEEFVSNGEALGFSDASPGKTFLKIGVGALRKPDNAKYSIFRLYEIVDHGKWSIDRKPGSIRFTQRIFDRTSGYGYLYEKTLQLVPGRPRMVIEHTITNIGKRPIETSVYDHNFLVLDKQPVGPDFTITVPFTIQLKKPINEDLGKVEGNRILYRKQMKGRDLFTASIGGFGETAKDYDIKIENKRLSAGMRITGDRPLESEQLWSIRSVLAMEPFVHMKIATGQKFSWKYTYLYYTVPGK
jgi:hypothetical protein